MKIAIFTDTFYPQLNGVSNFAFFCAEGLSARGHEVQVFTAISPKDAEALDCSQLKFKINSIPSLPAPVYRSGHYRVAIPAGWSLRELKKFNPDVIHVHTPFAMGMEAARGAKKLKIPLVGEHHTFYDHYLKHLKMDYRWAKKASWKITVRYYNKCDLVVSPSKSLAETLQEFGLTKPTCVIPNGINTDLFYPLKPEEKNKIKKIYGIEGLSVVYMGRVSYEKNIAQVINGFAELLKEDGMKNVKLMLVGDGPERENLENLIKELKIEKSMVWTGILRGEDLAKALAANDVFVTASKSENMPLSVIEAMAAGLPLVLAAEKGLKEMIKDGRNGYLFNADDAKEMAGKIKEILENEELRKKMAENSRIIAMGYSSKKVMAMFEECYQEAINNFKNKTE